jgi:hypothetical protein
MEGVALNDRFNCLFELCDKELATVAENEHLERGASGEAWKWRRHLRAWEEEQLRECSASLNSIILQDDITVEVAVESSHFKILHCQQCLQTSSQHINADDTNVSLNVNIFVWSLLLHRLLTNNNFVGVGGCASGELSTMCGVMW